MRLLNFVSNLSKIQIVLNIVYSSESLNYHPGHLHIREIKLQNPLRETHT
jgi:hypothetical protein